MAVGHAKKDKIFYKAKGVNKAVVYVGSKTGRDGIHGTSSNQLNLMKIEMKKQFGLVIHLSKYLEACQINER